MSKWCQNSVFNVFFITFSKGGSESYSLSTQTTLSTAVEIIAPSVIMGIEKFVVQKGRKRGDAGEKEIRMLLKRNRKYTIHTYVRTYVRTHTHTHTYIHTYIHT